jgi:hypothetical protein
MIFPGFKGLLAFFQIERVNPPLSLTAWPLPDHALSKRRTSGNSGGGGCVVDVPNPSEISLEIETLVSTQREKEPFFIPMCFFYFQTMDVFVKYFFAE